MSDEDYEEEVQYETEEQTENFAGPIDNLVGPISEKYCYYFYILSVLAILFFVVVFAGIIYTALSSKQKLNPWHIFLLLVYSCQFLLIYLQNRLLYNMCIQSI
jgi:hypothetical protein